MVQEFAQDILASVLMIDGAAYVPLYVVSEEFIPILVATGLFFGASMFFAFEALKWLGEGLRLLGTALLERIKARRESKAVEKLIRDDPAFAAAWEALDKLDPDYFKKLFNSRNASESE